VIMFFAFSIVIDIIWLIVISWKTWFDPSYERLAPWEHTLHVMTVVLVLINLVLKLISIALSFVYSNDVKEGFSNMNN